MASHTFLRLRARYYELPSIKGLLMKFQTHNDLPDLEKKNLAYAGQLMLSYEQLIERFGEPKLSGYDGAKTKAQWVIAFDDGMLATIYDWKEYSKETDEITDWHIGSKMGQGNTIMDRVQDLMTTHIPSPSTSGM